MVMFWDICRSLDYSGIDLYNIYTTLSESTAIELATNLSKMASKLYLLHVIVSRSLPLRYTKEVGSSTYYGGTPNKGDPP